MPVFEMLYRLTALEELNFKVVLEELIGLQLSLPKWNGFPI